MPPTLSAPRLSLVPDRSSRSLGLVEPMWTTRQGLLRIRSVNSAGHWTLELDGELDLSNSGALADEVRLAETSAETITIDLRALTFMDSSGLHVIAAAQKRSGQHHQLRLRKGPRGVQRVFQLTGTEGQLPFVS